MSNITRVEIHYKIELYPPVYLCLMGGCDGLGIKRETSKEEEIYCMEELCKMNPHIRKEACITLKI